jgi:hypothetical protein
MAIKKHKYLAFLVLSIEKNTITSFLSFIYIDVKHFGESYTYFFIIR